MKQQLKNILIRFFNVNVIRGLSDERIDRLIDDLIHEMKACQSDSPKTRAASNRS